MSGGAADGGYVGGARDPGCHVAAPWPGCHAPAPWGLYSRAPSHSTPTFFLHHPVVMASGSTESKMLLAPVGPATKRQQQQQQQQSATHLMVLACSAIRLASSGRRQPTGNKTGRRKGGMNIPHDELWQYFSSKQRGGQKTVSESAVPSLRSLARSGPCEISHEPPAPRATRAGRRRQIPYSDGQHDSQGAGIPAPSRVAATEGPCAPVRGEPGRRRRRHLPPAVSVSIEVVCFADAADGHGEEPTQDAADEPEPARGRAGRETADVGRVSVGVHDTCMIPVRYLFARLSVISVHRVRFCNILSPLSLGRSERGGGAGAWHRGARARPTLGAPRRGTGVDGATSRHHPGP